MYILTDGIYCSLPQSGLSSGDHLVVNYDKTKTAKLYITTIAYSNKRRRSAACPCCLPILLVNDAYTCCMSVLNVRAACSCCMS